MGGPRALPGWTRYGDCSVLSSCILSVLPRGHRVGLIPNLHRLRFEPGEAIFRQGALTAGVYVLCRGHAKLEFRAPSEKRLLIGFCGPGDLLTGAFSEEHVMSAVAVDAAVVTLIPKELALGLLKGQPELALEAARRLSRERDMLLERLVYFAHGGVRARLARGLLGLGEGFGVCREEGLRIELPLSLREVAEMIGASPQTTSQELHALAKRGLIKVAWPTISILDPDALRQLG